MLFAFLYIMFVMFYIFCFKYVKLNAYTNIFELKIDTKKFCVSCCCLGNSFKESSKQFGHMYCGYSIISMQVVSAYSEC